MINSSILIVEDDVKLNNFLAEYMQTHFELVYSAFDGQEAFDIFNKYTPSVIITDINMPKLNGLELIKKIRKIDKMVQVIILSAHTDKNKLLDAIPLNLVKYLVKPIKSDDLREVISNIKNDLKDNKSIVISKYYKFNISTNQLFYKQDEIKLTKQEKAFISLLLQTPNNCVSYTSISQHVYDLEEFSQNSLFSMIKRVRKKLHEDFITTCHKEGYKISI